MHEYILTLSCPDKVGIVAAVSNFLADEHCNIFDSAQYGDAATRLFFMRVHFRAEETAAFGTIISERFAALAHRFSMNWTLVPAGQRDRLLIMVSKLGHCLNDLLYRHRTGSLNADIIGIVSNHQEFEELASWHGIPYHFLPITPDNKERQEEELRRLIGRERIDLVVLARYMQILSPKLCAQLRGRCINIHHSFLPSFKGARPYDRAYQRGVKLIGATAHYVTDDLDEGPIIEQGVERVDHAHSIEDMVSIGRDIESLVLSRAVRYHLERRVLLNGNKTVILR